MLSNTYLQRLLGQSLRQSKELEVVSVENLKRSLPPIASSAENQPLTMDNSSLQANRDVPTTPLLIEKRTQRSCRK